MANTVPILNFTNTFGDLVSAQNRAGIELNNLGANNYTKDSGTLFLNGSGTGLSVTNAGLFGSAIVSGVLSVGSSVSALANVFINGAGNGLEVANNSLLRGSLVTNQINANTLIRTTTLNATGNVFANDISSNNLIRTTTLNAQGNVFVNNLQSNGAIFGASANIVGLTVTNSLVSNTSITGSTFYLSNDGIIDGSLSVGGDFIIDGTTVYNTNTFIINANSSIGAISIFGVNRGTSGANAAIRWNENQDYWDIIDVNNPSSYSKILTANLISNSITSTSQDTMASSLAANTLNNALQANVISLQSQIAANTTSLQNQITANVNAINAALSINQGVDNTQNTQISGIQGVDLAQNASIVIIQGVDATQNVRLGSIETINNNQNTTISIIQGVDATQNVQIAGIQGVDNSQNTRMSIIEAVNSSQNTTITQVNQFAAGAFTTANGANGLAQGAFNAANNKVSSITGSGPDQVIVEGPSTSPTLYLPQSINTSSSVRFGSFGVGTAASGTTGEIRATNNITAYYSDDRLKTRLGNIENALSKLLTLNGFYHEANETAQALGYDKVREVGVSAQEVEKVMPEVVAPAPIDPQYMTVRYERLVPLLIEAIKELKAEIDSIKKS